MNGPVFGVHVKTYQTSSARYQGNVSGLLAISDSRRGFANALEERGYYLAKGDRRCFVAVDWRGEVYAISRWVGIKAKDVKAKHGNPDEMLTVEETKKWLTEKITAKLH